MDQYFLWIFKQKQHSFCCLDILHYITQVFESFDSGCPGRCGRLVSRMLRSGREQHGESKYPARGNIEPEGNFRWKFLKIFLQKEISRLPSIPDNIFSTRRWKYSSRTRGRGNKSLPRCRLSPSDKDRFGKLSPRKCFLLNYTQLLF